MTRNYTVRQGFGKGHVKEFFVAETELGAVRAFVAGPFENRDQAAWALDALRPLYSRRELAIVGGHLAELGSG